jgi:hypothetical protein
MSAPQAEALLAAPAGRAVLARLIGLDSFDLLSGMGKPLPGNAARLESATPRAARRETESDPRRHREAAEVVAAAVADVDLGQLARCRDQLLLLAVLARMIEDPDAGAGAELAAARGALLPVAQALVAAPAARWWWEPADRDRQRWVGMDGAEPPRGAAVTEAVRRAVAEEGREEEQQTSLATRGRFWRRRQRSARSVSWWSAPLGGTVFTSTGPIDILPAAELGLVEDSAGEELAEVWAIGIDPGARVREILGPADWARLAAEFPRDVTASRRYDWDRWTGQRGPWILPDWLAAAREWDGIHLSIGGYLTAARLPLAAGSAMTLLAGWEPDQTLWLNDSFTTADRVGSWRGTPGSDALPEVTLPWLEYR